MNKFDWVVPIIICLAFAGIFGCLFLMQYVLNDATGISDNKEVIGVFQSLEADGKYLTLHFNNSSVTFWQSDGVYGLGSNSLQVPFVIGNTYQVIFAVHGHGESSYLTLQSVVEVP